MATKKAKRAAGLAKHEAFMAEQAELGRQAIERGKAERHQKLLQDWEKGHQKHYTFVDECPHCTIIKQEQARQKAGEALAKVAAATKATQAAARLSRIPRAEIEGVDVFHPFASKVNA
jgi:hypothetical protein